MPERLKMALIIAGITFIIFFTIGVYTEKKKCKTIDWKTIFLAVGILTLGVFGFGMLDSSYSMDVPKNTSNNKSTVRIMPTNTPNPFSFLVEISKYFPTKAPTSTPAPADGPRKGMIKPDYSEYTFYCETGYTYDFDSSFYVVNTYSNKYHRPSCEYARQMSYENMMFWYGPKGNLGIKGYSKCHFCTP